VAKSDRNAEVLALIERYTKRAATTRASARKALISEGIYTPGGKLRAEFGGETVEPDAA
jgi:hypothetical protein